LANDPSKRLEEFEELIARTHNAGMKVLIDIVPNHVARKYEGHTNPEGTKDFGAEDDTTVTYHVNNNFYYNPGEDFRFRNGRMGTSLLEGKNIPLPMGNSKKSRQNGPGMVPASHNRI
jgi:glycosidase